MADARLFDSGFPFYSWYAGTPQFDGAFPMGLGIAPVAPVKYIAEILIGSQVVWSAENAVAQQTVAIDVSAFEGIFPVKFRIRAK